MNHQKMSLILLNGARGDLRLGFDGGFSYQPAGESKPEYHPALIMLMPESAGLKLTRAGAEFLLENLEGCYTDREKRQLIRMAEGEG